MVRLALLLAGAACAVACGAERDAPRAARLAEDDSPAPVRVVGVSPLDFRCDMVVNIEAVAGAVGGPVDLVASGFSPPVGVPAPCHYVSTAADHPGDWSFDIDCRDHALDQAGQLMAEFGVDPTAKAVLVGRSGLDHHGVQLLFIDDDAPCYVRVMGQGEAQRLALGQLVADGLMRSNAPGRVLYKE